MARRDLGCTVADYIQMEGWGTRILDLTLGYVCVYGPG